MLLAIAAAGFAAPALGAHPAGAVTPADASAPAAAAPGTAPLTVDQIRHAYNPKPGVHATPTVPLARQIARSAGTTQAAVIGGSPSNASPALASGASKAQTNSSPAGDASQSSGFAFEGMGNLYYHGGPVMQAHNDTVPIFWFPPTLQDGTAATPDPGYIPLLEQYFDDIGGSTLNELNTQYFQTVNGPAEYIVNSSHRVLAVIDTSPYPPAAPECAATSINCLGYQQLQNEVEAVRTAHALPAGLGTGYFLFTAPHESSCYLTTACFTADGTSPATAAYCAFHSYYFEGTDPVMWANMPYGAYTSAGCTALDAFPNNRDADIEISLTSHEQMEMTTDPEVNAWLDTFGAENGDKCAYDYGVLGLDGGLANEEWNGHFYVVQQEWSNARNGCAQDAVSHAVANDDLASASQISGEYGTFFASNGWATKEPGEPTPAGNAGGHSIWLTWTPNFSGPMVFDTCDSDRLGLVPRGVSSDFDTLLGVYTGASVDTLTPVAENDNAPACGAQSSVTATVTSGVRYWIEIDGAGGASGNIVLHWLRPAPNDDFASALELSGDQTGVYGHNALATKEPGEPTPAGNVGGHSLWYSYTPAKAGQLSVSTCAVGDVATLVGVYTGNTVTALTPVAETHVGPTGSECSLGLTVTAGVRYSIEVDGIDGATGVFFLLLQLAPLNDNFSAAEPLTGFRGTTSGDNSFAGTEPGEPNPAGRGGGHSLWYSYTPAVDGSITFDTCASTFDTVLGVYIGSTVGTLSPLAEDDNGCGAQSLQSRVTLQVFKGQKYWIDVDGAAGATGTATLQWVMPDAPPLPGSWTGPAPVTGTTSLTSVSCASITRCIAVDSAGNAFVYDGRKWSAPATADPNGSLTSVSCTGSRCVSVASNGDAVSLLGSRWSAPVRADPAGGLLSVSCPSANFCAAIDFFGNVATYNGTSWSSPVSIDSESLTSISCSALGQCVAVDLTGRAVTLRSGTWSAPVDVGAGALTSVSCPTNTFCAAVGDGGLGATFDGQSWSAPTDLGAGPLTSVSCPTATFCAAVGTTGSGTTFDGQTWSAPAVADPAGGIVAVSCATPRRCQAVDASSFTTYVGVLGGAIVVTPRIVIGNTDIRIRGTAWDLDEDSSVTIYECVTPSFSASTCATANATTVPVDSHGRIGLARVRAIAGPIDGSGDTCGLVGSPPCSIVVVGNLGDVTSARIPFQAPMFTVSAPYLRANATETVRAHYFPAGDVVSVQQCEAGTTVATVATTCDPGTRITLIVNSRGLAGFHMPDHVGAAYSDPAGGTCSPGDTCSIFVTDLTTPAIARSVPLPVT